MPMLYAGRNCRSQSKYASFFTEKRGVIMPHLFIFAKSWTWHLPALPSSICSNSPMYRCFCITRSTSLENLDAGRIMHSRFLLVSLLYIVVNMFESTFRAGIPSTYSYFTNPRLFATSLKHCLQSIRL